MRLAWCRPTTGLSDRLDDSVTLIDELRSHHDITRLDQSSMHDLVRLDSRQPFDLLVYELADTDDHACLWPYVFHYPGIVRLRSGSLHHSRATSLARQRRGDDRRAELAFGRGDLSVAPILASRMVVVHDEHLADSLRRDYPHTQIRVVPVGWGRESFFSEPSAKNDSRPHSPLRIGVLGHVPRQTIVRAVQRAMQSGASLELMAEASPDAVLREADVILALPWPPSDDPIPAIAAMSSGRPLVIFETESSAGWPTLDPQTWLPRGIDVHERPIAVAIDPRDEEHSLALALRRLATDSSLAANLGRAAQAWWREHATLSQAVTAWQAALKEAASLAPPRRGEDWPPHLTADGTARARAILGEFAVTVDFLG
ncbi:MAG TPA: hypothetical protein VKB50_14380 [Vicinamibacterales bacterium]|nr:hypothetical protein [Vicinamibacterales bacterium]